MNDFSVSITDPGTKKYPLHQHSNWEIMYYLSGVGYLDTQQGHIPFSPGTVIIVPPRIAHGSVSENGFVNISLGGNFLHLFMFDKIMVQQDNAAENGKRLAQLIYEGRHGSPEYLSSLCSAYAQFLLDNAKYEKRVHREVNRIIDGITRNFFDPALDVTALLQQSGYAEDYIRAEFKKVTHLTPIDFLTKVRIDHSRRLFEIYGESISVAEVAESCGFDDPVYFSKRFKKCIGTSPNAYRKQKAW